jgi:VanZ family protein
VRPNDVPSRPGAILERLGEFPNWRGKRSLRDSLARVHEAASRYALEYVFGHQMMNTPTQHDNAAVAGGKVPGRTRHALILAFWAVLVCCVVIGSLSPAASPAMVAVGRMHINDKVMHFCAYLALSLLPVIGFKDRRAGLKAGLSMFILGILLEGGQHFSPGRAVELGDVIANGAGVRCGASLGLPIRACIALL